MSIELLQKINNNYQMAICVHREIADVFWFTYQYGYALWHEYQYFEESCTQRRIKRYITTTYHVFVPDQLPKGANISEPLLKGKNRKEIKTEESWGIVQEIFRVYKEFEESNLQKYQQIATEIISNGDISTFNFVSEIIKDVKKELVFVTDKTIELAAHDYDMPTIMAEQAEYMERYEYKIRHMLGKSKEYHHFNSMHDDESRLSVLDKYSD